MRGQHKTWVDLSKIFACILVAGGHFLQSMVSANVIAESSTYAWFIQTIYFFHVPLFFLCSGYLHQGKGKNWSVGIWGSTVLKKLIVLGIPYFVFSLATWLLKEAFSGAVNNQNSGLLYSLLISLMSPYWYLYTLFFVFLITPAFQKKAGLYGAIAFACLLKIADWILPQCEIYAVRTVMQNLIWFLLGAWIAGAKEPKKPNPKATAVVGCGLFAVFLVGSVLVSALEIHMGPISFVLGLLGCAATVFVAVGVARYRWFQNITNMLAQYTLPVFLMHTIFAAGIRAVLLKLGITQPAIHILLGLLASFVGPTVAAIVMKKIKLDILYNPGKYIKLKKKTEEQNNG